MEVIHGALGRLLCLAAVLLASLTACDKATINPGPIEGETIVLDNARGAVWCEIIPIVGTPPDAIFHLYTSTSIDDCSEERAAAIDAEKLAQELGVGRVVLNPSRYWIMDRVTVYQAGETVELAGVKVKWAATLTPESIREITGPPYTVAEIKRDTEWLYRKGNPVYLLRSPDSRVWVMQILAGAGNSELTLKTLDKLGDELVLPEGWSYESRVLEKDLSIEPRRAQGIAYIMRDNLGNAYQGCGFDAACTYIP